MSRLNSLIVGIMIIPFLAALFALPYISYRYKCRKHSMLSKRRILVIYSFVLYLLFLFLLIILPLPDPVSTIGNHWYDHFNLIPFMSLYRWWRNRLLELSTFVTFLDSFTLWQLVLNTLMIVPFGAYLCYFKQGFRRTVVLSLILSFFFEITQMSALFGIYPGPYRWVDIDDLIFNTLGGAIGFQIARVYLDAPSRLCVIGSCCHEATWQDAGNRRLCAILIDSICSFVLYIFLYGVVRFAFRCAPMNLHYRVWRHYWIVFCAFSFIQVFMTKSSTLGHAICRMVLVSKDGSMATSWQLVKHYFSLYVFVVLPSIIVRMVVDLGALGHLSEHSHVILCRMLLSGIYPCFFLISLLCRYSSVQMLHEKVSGTTYMTVDYSRCEQP